MAKILVYIFFGLCICPLFMKDSYAFQYADRGWEDMPIEGRYTRDIHDYEVLVPSRIDHQGSFVSNYLPNFFERDTKRTKRHARLDHERVHYGIHFDGKDHMVELWPNHGLLSPGLVLETRTSGSATDLNKLKIRSVEDKHCHYTGWIKGEHGSRVALSACSGLAGHIRTKRNHYYIEPVKDHEPEEDGQHLHIVYKRRINDNKNKRSCGTSDDWETAWSNRLAAEYRQRGPDTDLKVDSVQRRATARAMQEHYPGKGSAEGSNNYLETLVVVDKKFLQARNGTDYEQYVFTAVNMASDILHDDTVGYQLDLVLVRVIYLEKEEEEFDLTISRDADATLTSFCKWSKRMNPMLTHPNHHDIAVLITKHDICAGWDDCGTVGLANVAGCCGPESSCAICEDTGLVVGTVMAHEIGHLLGSSHDSDDDHPPPGECPGAVGDYNIHVMASWSQVSPANWSICSKKFITEFFENGLGECLLDEPQDHDFKLPQMPPGVVYDREWQCKDYFGPTKPCDLGPDRNCKHLSCAPAGSDHCRTKGPPADGTSCGNNKWCFGGNCVEVGTRPGAVNGEWSEWGSWSECSRTCGGGASYCERQCDNPRPENNGRFCVGKRRRYRLCNTEPCDEDALPFREVQCKEHNKGDITWVPHNDGKPEHVCSLICLNNKYVFQTLERRVKDGTPCKRGTKNRCIAGKCRNVGCDWVFDSDAVEDMCGVCNGDASTCDIVDDVYKESGRDYQKIVTIPAGSRYITVEEMKPSQNFLALSAADGKTFYLNGDHTIDTNGERKFAGSISVYTTVEPLKESLVIAGPTKEDLILYILNNVDPNPGIHYKYSIPSKSSSYKPKFSWEFIEWSPCSVFCGGGTQISEPSCIEKRGGKVSKKHCEQIPKPEVSTKVCNEQVCKIKWRTGTWSKCNGCIDKLGHRYRVVDCVKQSPFEDSEVIVEEDECKKEKPPNKESCTSNEPCGDTPSKRQVPLDDELGALEDNLLSESTSSNCHESKPKPIVKEDDCMKNRKNNERYRGGPRKDDSGEKSGGYRKGKTNRKKIIHGGSNKCKDKTNPRKTELVVDKVNPDRFKYIEIPMEEDVDDFSFSEEALENVGDKVPSPIDTKKIKEFKGDDAQRKLQDSKKKNEDKHENEDENEYIY